MPDRVKPLPDAPRSDRQANVIVLGPAYNYQHHPQPAHAGIVEAIVKSTGARFLYLQCGDPWGETTGFSAADHVQAAGAFITGPARLYCCQFDLTVSSEGLAFLNRHGSALVQPAYQDLRKMNPRMISAPLLDHGQVTRHDGRRLARLIMEHALPPRRRSWTGRREEHLQHRQAGRRVEARKEKPISASGGGG